MPLSAAVQGYGALGSEYMPKCLAMMQLTQGRHQMIVGDIKDTYAHQMDLHGLPDYLFLDSYHSYGFGMW